MSTTSKYKLFAFLILVAATVTVWASNPPLERASQVFNTQKITATTGAAQRLFADPAKYLNDREGLCITNERLNPAEKVLIANYETVDDDEGYPIYGGQEKCFEWGPNIRVWVYQEDGTANSSVKGVQWQ